MITSVGKFLRKLRIDNAEVLRDMAAKLGVSSAFLSAVENGKKKVPKKWVKTISDLYSLTSTQISDFENAIDESSETIELDIREAPLENRKLAITFARAFNSLDETAIGKIQSIIDNREEERN